MMNWGRYMNARTMPLVMTCVLFAVMFGYGAISYEGFFSLQVFLNLLIDNAFLWIVAIGMTFVILTGGIDLSVGSVVALTSMIIASLVEHHQWSIWQVIPLVLVLGTLFGLAMGWLIQAYQIQPFIVTLGGMFLYTKVAHYQIPLGGGAFISISVVIGLLTLAAAIWLAHQTRFGRTVYAIGGNERSAQLMGLPVARTKVLVYGLSGFCSALGGVVLTFYMLSGYGLHAQGMELDAIAAAVIGGTLLTGGAGYVAGTMVGVLILGLIQSLITFDGTLSSWWTRIAVGALLCFFCLMQRVLEHGVTLRKTAKRNAPKAVAATG